MASLAYAAPIALALAVSAASLPVLAEPAGERHAYFGDLHLHTAISVDAYAFFGTRTTPDEAYRFGRGETITLVGHKIRRAWPLDFMAVTDHSESMGMMTELDKPDTPIAKSEFGQKINAGRTGKTVEMSALYKMFNGVGATKEIIRSAGESAWKQEIDAANKNYAPGKFTTLIAYEWSSMWDGKYNLHRNVFFSGDTAPFPFSSVDSNKPEDLWAYMENARKNGFDLIAHPP